MDNTGLVLSCVTALFHATPTFVRREISTADLRWIDVIDPSKADLSFLRETFHIHPTHLEECRRESLRPRMEFHPDYMFMIVHTARHLPKDHATVPAEIDLIVTPQAIISVHVGSAKQLEMLYTEATKQADARDRLVGRGAAYLLFRILDQLFDTAFPMMDHIAENLTRAEKRIFSGEERQMVIALSAIQRDLSGFRNIVRPQRQLFDPGMLQSGWDTPTFQVVFRRVHGKLTRLWDHLETLQERTEALAATNALLVNNKLNEFVKILTVLGALFIPFGLIAQVIISLNDSTPLPNRLVFWVIIAAMLVTDFVILWRAREKGIL